jgi:glycosyltransferase involved in cell wall biosynthesis
VAEIALYFVYLCVGPVAWILFGIAIHAGQRKMLLLKRPATPIPAKMGKPSVSIIVPAKDEGERIRGCIESCLGQDYPNFEVMAVDDRSVDNTGQVMDAMARENPKLKVVHIQEGTLEPGWTGKNNALHQAQKQSTADWMLFVDSDVVLEKDALSAALGVALNKVYDMVSLLPRLESHTIWETTLVPLAASAASTMYLINLNNNDRVKTAFANGQFMLMSRKVYDAIGGHDAVKDRYCEDVEIAARMKRADYRPRIAWGNDWAAVRMYSSLAGIFRGWSRIYYAARVGSPWRTLTAAIFLVVCCFTAYAALAWGIYRLIHAGGPVYAAWFAAAIAHLAIMTWFLGTLYFWSGNPRRNAFFFPIAGPMLLGIMIRALYMCVTKKVTWRGTAYQHVMAAKLPDAKQSDVPAAERTL